MVSVANDLPYNIPGGTRDHHHSDSYREAGDTACAIHGWYRSLPAYSGEERQAWNETVETRVEAVREVEVVLKAIAVSET